MSGSVSMSGIYRAAIVEPECRRPTTSFGHGKRDMHHNLASSISGPLLECGWQWASEYGYYRNPRFGPWLQAEFPSGLASETPHESC
jgi:hypothetical protein